MTAELTATDSPATPPVAPSGLGRALLPVHAVVEHGPLRIEEIVAVTELPLSTAYRRVEELRRLGYLQRLPLPPGCSVAVSGRRFEPGPRTRELARWSSGATRPRRVATAEDVLRRAAPSAPAGWLHHLAGQLVDALDPEAGRARG